MPIRTEKVVWTAVHDGKEFTDEAECTKYERVHEMYEFLNGHHDIDPRDCNLETVAEAILVQYGVLTSEQIKDCTDALDSLKGALEPLVNGQEVTLEQARIMKRTLAEIDRIIRSC